MSTSTYTLGTDEADRWRETLQRCTDYDVYHLPEYHRLVEEQEGSQAVLFVYESQSAIVAMPILLREIEGLPGLDALEYRDVTSVYGYPGPVSNNPIPSEELGHRFGEALRDHLKDNQVVSAFSRLHPLFDQSPLLRGNGQVLTIGTTIAIDLSLPVDVQRQQYRANHKRDINRARREGIACVHDENWNYFDTFVEIYYETMRRTGASDYYFFDRTYFTHLRELLDDRLHLFVALKEGVVLSGALFTVCNSTIQYHLGGTDSQYLDLAPSKLIFDTVRLWGTEIGGHFLHLGGGLRSREDGLYRFKAGFSKLRYQFSIWRMVVDQGMYNQLAKQKRAWNKANGLEAIDGDYFPAYRCPTRKVPYV